MKYEFPKISNINDVLPYIEDRSEFTLKYRQSELEIVGNIQDETA